MEHTSRRTTSSGGVMTEDNRAFEIESMISKLTNESFPNGRIKDLTSKESTLYALYHLSRLYSGMVLGQKNEQSKQEAWTAISFIRDAVHNLEQENKGEL